jgi:hypothetical protein
MSSAKAGAAGESRKVLNAGFCKKKKKRGE